MPGIVLVHGSWHGAWAWDRLVPLLRDRGLEVRAPDLPGRASDGRVPAEVSLEDHADAVIAAAAELPPPIVLVGHSFGGAVISRVAERIPERVSLLVYLAAFLLRDGETVLDMARSVDRPAPHLDVDDAARLIRVRPEAAREAFYHDCSEEDADRATANLVPEALEPRLTPMRVSAGRFGSVPRVYVETTEDRALPIAIQRRMHEALPCAAIAPIASGHSPFLSMPDALAEQLVLLSRAYVADEAPAPRRR
jgi:pimeloyl-ACP methyl ester carboxylesterase